MTTISSTFARAMELPRLEDYPDDMQGSPWVRLMIRSGRAELGVDAAPDRPRIPPPARRYSCGCYDLTGQIGDLLDVGYPPAGSPRKPLAR
jgi:hypothetical protein